jgi:molybdenum cofactor cytidylyltransferase
MDPVGIEAIITAAGRSQRMGAVNKLLLPVDGVAMVRRSVALYTRVASPVTVVLGHDKAAVAAALAGLDLRLVENPQVDAGQQESVRIGLGAAALQGRGLLIALADQPLLTATDLERFIAFFDEQGGAKICVPMRNGVRGNPVLFPTVLARRMRDDPAAPGGRKFIDGHAELVARFEADNDHFTSDVDTPADAAGLLGIDVGPS